MNKQHKEALALLRDDGFVVIAWTPEEVGDADPAELEDYVTSKGNDWLADNGGKEVDEDDEESGAFNLDEE